MYEHICMIEVYIKVSKFLVRILKHIFADIFSFLCRKMTMEAFPDALNYEKGIMSTLYNGQRQKSFLDLGHLDL